MLTQRRRGAEKSNRKKSLVKVSAPQSLYVEGYQGIIICLALLFLTACGDGRANYPPRSMPAELLKDPSALTVAKQIFQRNCAYCHGKVDEGRTSRADSYYPPAPDFTEARYRTSDPAYLYWRIETGKSIEPYQSQGSVMPAWGQHFNETQIWQLVVLLKLRAEHGGNPP